MGVIMRTRDGCNNENKGNNNIMENVRPVVLTVDIVI